MRGRLILMAAMMIGTSMKAQEPKPLWPAGAPLAQGTADVDVPTLTTYLPGANPTKSAVIVCPGGGYAHLSMEKEGADVAKWMNAHGVAAFVLKYRLGMKYHHPAELMDAQRAIRTVRAQAASLGIAPDHIGIMGFSAGGHLAASAETLYDLLPPPANPDAIDRESARPDFAVLAYPVITMDPKYAHMGSRLNLLGENPDQALADQQDAADVSLHDDRRRDGTGDEQRSVLFCPRAGQGVGGAAHLPARTSRGGAGLLDAGSSRLAGFAGDLDAG